MQRKGSFVSCNNMEQFKQHASLLASWVDCSCRVGSVELPHLVGEVYDLLKVLGVRFD